MIKNIRSQKKYSIAIFFETIMLSVIGGTIGMFLWVCAISLCALLDYEWVLPFLHIMIEIVLATIIGLLSGIISTISASKLDPVEAMHTGK